MICLCKFNKKNISFLVISHFNEYPLFNNQNCKTISLKIILNNLLICLSLTPNRMSMKDRIKTLRDYTNDYHKSVVNHLRNFGARLQKILIGRKNGIRYWIGILKRPKSVGLKMLS